jgi:hypothetical protein
MDAASSGRERDPHLSRFNEDRGNQWGPFDERNQRMGSVFVSLARVFAKNPGAAGASCSAGSYAWALAGVPRIRRRRGIPRARQPRARE